MDGVDEGLSATTAVCALPRPPPQAKEGVGDTKAACDDNAAEPNASTQQASAHAAGRRLDPAMGMPRSVGHAMTNSPSTPADDARAGAS